MEDFGWEERWGSKEMKLSRAWDNNDRRRATILSHRSTGVWGGI